MFAQFLLLELQAYVLRRRFKRRAAFGIVVRSLLLQQGRGSVPPQKQVRELQSDSRHAASSRGVVLGAGSASLADSFEEDEADEYSRGAPRLPWGITKRVIHEAPVPIWSEGAAARHRMAGAASLSKSGLGAPFRWRPSADRACKLVHSALR